MAMQRYTVTPHPIESLLTWVKSGEIQRPFVWEATNDQQGSGLVSCIRHRSQVVHEDAHEPVQIQLAEFS